ncbi:RNase P modulator RnpM [Chloroflexota bacterium]
MASGSRNGVEQTQPMRGTRTITKTGSSATKHTPQRTCVACRQVKTKQELIRLVHTADSDVEIDTGGKKAGRGAYLCPARECWENGLKNNRLEHALQTRLTPDKREQLIKYARDFLRGAD